MDLRTAAQAVVDEWDQDADFYRPAFDDAIARLRHALTAPPEAEGRRGLAVSRVLTKARLRALPDGGWYAAYCAGGEAAREVLLKALADSEDAADARYVIECRVTWTEPAQTQEEGQRDG